MTESQQLTLIAIDAPQMKQCSTCKADLPPTLFCTNRQAKNGLNFACRNCVTERHQRRAATAAQRRAGVSNKTCSVCKITKAVAEFQFGTLTKDGYSTYCKKCTNERRSSERSTPNSDAFFKGVATTLRRRLGLKGESGWENKGVKLARVVIQIKSIVTPECPGCGTELVYASGGTAAIDHIKPLSKHVDLGQKLSNLRWLCKNCNIAKWHHYEEDHNAWLIKAYKYRVAKGAIAE